MRFRSTWLFALLAALVLAAPSAAQVQQSGSITIGHPSSWVTNGVIGDAGPATNGKLGGVGITANSLTGNCQNTHIVSSPPAYAELCTGLTDSQAQITLQGYGEPTPPLQLCIAGVCTPLPQSQGGPFVSRQITTGLTDTASPADGAIEWNSSTVGPKTENIYTCGPAVKGYSLVIADEAATAGTYPIVLLASGGNTIANGAQNGSSALISTSAGGTRLICDGVSTWTYFPSYPSAMFHWFNAAAYGAISDEDDSTTCTWSAATLTCPNKTFPTTLTGKTIAIDYAGSSFNSFTSTLTYVSAHVATMGSSPTTAGPIVRVTQLGTPVAGGSGYLIGDSLCLANGNTGVGTIYSQACGTISAIQTIGCNSGCSSANVTVTANGSGGTDNATCDLIGTTGYPLAGGYVDVNVTLSASGDMGAGSSINTVTTSIYTKNMTAPTAEPMTGSGCGSITGVTMSFPFAVANAKASLTNGFYSAITCSSSTYTTTTNGSGTGATTKCNSLTAVARWGTDNTIAFKAVATAASTAAINIAPNCVYIPAGKYLTQPLNTPTNGYGCWKGDANFHSVLFMIPNVAGDLISSLNAGSSAGQQQGGTFAYSDDANPNHAGLFIRDLMVVGMRSSSQIQNALEMYGVTKWADIQNFFVFYVRGRAMGVGDDGTGRGNLFESTIWNNRFENDGDAPGAIPTMDIGSTSGQPNGLSFKRNRMFDNWGPSAAIYTCAPGTNIAAHLITWEDTHIESSGMDGTAAVGDQLQLGRNGCTSWSFPTVTGGTVMGTQDNGITGVVGTGDTFTNAIGGTPVTTTCNSNTTTLSPYAAIHVYGYCNGGGFIGPTINSNIYITANIGATGASFGGGVYLDAGNQATFRISHNGTNDWPYRAVSLSGASLGAGNMYDCLYAGCAVLNLLEASQQPTGATPTSYPVYTNTPGHSLTPLWVGTQAVTNSTTGAQSMFGTGIGANRFGNNTLNVGSTFEIQSAGVISSNATPGTITVTIALTGAPIAALTFTPAASLVNAGFNFRLRCTVYTIGSGGTVYCGGTFMVGNNAASAVESVLTFGNAASATTIDTTASGVINYKTQWNSGGPPAGDSITAQITTIALIN